MNDVVESPCVEVCQLRKGEKVCRGCYRTLDEIARWGKISPAQRRIIMNELLIRKSTADANS